MREIDKLVNKAYPDELRRVTPIPVDEKAILARTLGKLGLEEAAPAPESRPFSRKRARYQGKHGPKPEPQLVEMPREPARRRWTGWLGWAVAACMFIAAAVNFGPYVLQSMEVTPAAGGENKDFVRLIQGDPEQYAEIYEEEAASEPQVTLQVKSQTGKLLAKGVEVLSVSVRQLDSEIRVIAVSMEADMFDGVSNSAQYTFSILFPECDANEVTMFDVDLDLDGRWGVFQNARENWDGLTSVTFRVTGIDPDDPDSLQGTLQVTNLFMDYDAENVFLFHVDLDQNGGACFAYTFSEDEYVANGFTPPTDRDDTGNWAAAGTEDEDTMDGQADAHEH